MYRLPPRSTTISEVDSSFDRVGQRADPTTLAGRRPAHDHPVVPRALPRRGAKDGDVAVAIDDDVGAGIVTGGRRVVRPASRSRDRTRPTDHKDAAFGRAFPRAAGVERGAARGDRHRAGVIAAGDGARPQLRRAAADGHAEQAGVGIRRAGLDLAADVDVAADDDDVLRIVDPGS